MDLEILEQMWFTCWVKFKFSSIKIPKNFIQFERKIICPVSIKIEPRSATDLHEYNIYLVFETFIWILFEFNQLLMNRKFWFIIKWIDEDSAFLNGSETVLSSAKSKNLKISEEFGRSLINNRNNNGPSTLPWGTPWDTGRIRELVPLIEAYWLRLDK